MPSRGRGWCFPTPRPGSSRRWSKRVTRRGRSRWFCNSWPRSTAGQAVDYIVEKVRGLVGVLEEVKNQFLAFFDLIAFRLGQLRAKSNLGPALQGGKNLTAEDAFPATPRAGGGRVSEPLTLVGEE